MLAEEWGVQADMWSVTSWNELARDAVAAEEWNLLHPGEQARTAYVTDKLAGAEGPFVAVSDFMRAVPLQIARWVPATTTCSAPTGSASPTPVPPRGGSSTSTPQSVVVQALQALADAGEIEREQVAEAFDAVPHRRPDRRRRRQAGGRRRLTKDGAPAALRAVASSRAARPSLRGRDRACRDP